MATRLLEQRRSPRVSAAYPAVVRDRRGRLLTHGRTANISESGAFILGRLREALPIDQELIVELAVPAAPSPHRRRNATRTVCYRCRLARTQVLGQLAGLGIQFLEKLA